MSPELPDSLQSSSAEHQKPPAADVAILLCTYNGARFLPLQLASYEAQDFAGWRLFVSDDGSTDSTPDLLTAFQNKHGARRVSIRRGPCKGFAANFLALICDPAVKSDHYALSDQDDIWDIHKLSRARQFLYTAPAEEPVIYCSRTRLIDEHDDEIGLSTYYKKTDFRNALVQSLASGNTMVFNEEMRRLLMQAGPDVTVPSHDWWLYLANAAVGGKILYDSYPTVSYRMHARNVIGSNESARAKLLRARLLWQGLFRCWADMNVTALERIESLMTEDSRKTFEIFRRSRKLGVLPRVCGLVRSGVHRQSLLGDLGLLAAAIAGKI